MNEGWLTTGNSGLNQIYGNGSSTGGYVYPTTTKGVFGVPVTYTSTNNATAYYNASELLGS